MGGGDSKRGYPEFYIPQLYKWCNMDISAISIFSQQFLYLVRDEMKLPLLYLWH